MTLYMKKPIPVNAKQWFKLGDEPACAVIQQHQHQFKLATLEGGHNIIPGAWIVGPGHRGEFWVVQDDIFKATYEEI